MAISFEIIRDGRDYWATADGGPRFFVGRSVRYDHRVGLTNVFPGTPLQKLNFDADNYADRFGLWASVIAPTAACEGRSFLTLNSYDRAGFTFGFGQFAAHVPDGDFVRWFHVLLSLPEAGDYFPELSINGPRIHHRNLGPLESAQSSAALKVWLNPSSGAIDDAEALAAARLIHWTTNSRPARLAQVAQMISSFRGYLMRADRRGLIDGRTAAICCVIADLLHHGRGGRTVWDSVQRALTSGAPLERLLAVGGAAWAERRRTLGRAIHGDSALHRFVWSSPAHDFA